MGDLITLDDVSPLAPGPGEDNSITEEVRDLKREKAEVELDDLRNQIEYRRRYAGRIFVFVSIWLTAIFAVLLADGWSLWGPKDQTRP